MNKNHPEIRIVAVWLLLLFAMTTAGTGCSVLQLRTHPEGAIVPPSQEIEVLDPRTDPTGLPAVSLEQGGDGLMKVDVTPTILVFKYYYSGDRDFRGPLLSGGPYMISTKHPVNGESVYLPVQLPAGSPQVRYKSRSIDLDYGNRGVTITFGRHRPKVVYRNRPSARSLMAKHKASPSAKNVERANKYASGMAADGVAFSASVGKKLLLPVQNIFRALPFVSWLPVWDENYVPGDYARQQKAEYEKSRAVADSYLSDSTIPTIR